VSELLFDSKFTDNDTTHILMSCGVHWEVRDVRLCVPGTSILRKSLISKSLIFPYLGNCYLIPCRLIRASSTPTSRQVGDFTKTRVGIAKSCRSLIPNFDINNLFVSYDKLRQLNLYKLGFCYESLFASSLAVRNEEQTIVAAAGNV
jgi:hypothetical protein